METIYEIANPPQARKTTKSFRTDPYIENNTCPIEENDGSPSIECKEAENFEFGCPWTVWAAAIINRRVNQVAHTEITTNTVPIPKPIVENAYGNETTPVPMMVLQRSMVDVNIERFGRRLFSTSISDAVDIDTLSRIGTGVMSVNNVFPMRGELRLLSEWTLSND
jgi:hypothetical protein